jgi:hypothetical protein
MNKMEKSMILAGPPMTGKSERLRSILKDISQPLETIMTFQELNERPIPEKVKILGVDALRTIEEIEYVIDFAKAKGYQFVITTQIDVKELPDSMKTDFAVIEHRSDNFFWEYRKPYNPIKEGMILRPKYSLGEKVWVLMEANSGEGFELKNAKIVKISFEISENSDGYFQLYTLESEEGREEYKATDKDIFSNEKEFKESMIKIWELRVLK